jgi:putative peptidoglycan lipid II flippase
VAVEGERSLARGAAVVTVVTALSRATGFLRVIAVAAAMGTTFLANTYQTANTAPNVVFELVAAGVLTSIFVPTFVEYLSRGDREESWEAANALTSVALVVLTVVAIVVALFAPVIMRLLLIGVSKPALRSREVVLGTTFLRLFAPQIIFYGAGMIMTAALHAHRRFTMPALAPIFNNVIVIGVYVFYMIVRGGHSGLASIVTSEKILLGAGTTMGVVAMTLCLIPSLRGLGWRFRFDFDPRHEAVRRGARLGGWALSYAGGYQAGLIVVLILANRVEGGVAAYQWAYTFFYLPHALIGVPIFNVLFTAMSEHASVQDTKGVVNRLEDGIAMLAFILLPLSGLMIVLAEPIARLTLDYGLMTAGGAALVGRVLSAFALGLPMYSGFLVMTRAFYALSDAKTPALVNGVTVVAATVLGALAFFILPAEWAVAGLALGHSLGYLIGSLLLGRRLGRKLGADLMDRLRSALQRSLAGAFGATVVMVAAHLVLPDASKIGALGNVIGTSLAGAAGYVFFMARVSSPELAKLSGLVRSFRSSARG